MYSIQKWTEGKDVNRITALGDGQRVSKAKCSLTLSGLKPVCLGIGSTAAVPASQPSRVLTWPQSSLCWSWIRLTKPNTCRHLFLHYPVPSRAAENQESVTSSSSPLDSFYPQSLNSVQRLSGRWTHQWPVVELTKWRQSINPTKH